MAVTLEQVLCSERGFGLTKATPVQRAFCRAADGLPLRELARDPNVMRAFGGQEAIAEIERLNKSVANPVPPKEFYIVAAIRCGKSLFCAALALKIALTIDLNHIGKKEIARVSVVSLDKDKAGAVMEHLSGALDREDGALRRYKVTKPKPNGERIRVRRDDGRIVEIVIAAGKRAGGSLVSRWTVAAIFDEAARMVGEDEGVVNFDASRNAVIARLALLKNAQLAVVTSPWAPRGPVYKAVAKHWGKPTRSMVLVRATGPEMNPVLWTPEIVAEMRLNPDMLEAFKTDVLGEFADAESTFYAEAEIDGATRPRPIKLPWNHKSTYYAFMDPATRRNAWTLVIVEKPGGEDAVLRVAMARQWLPTAEKRLDSRVVLREVKGELADYGIAEVGTDQWSSDLIADMADILEFQVVDYQAAMPSLVKRHEKVLSLLRMGRLELPPDAYLRSDMLSVKKVVSTRGGMSIEIPKTADGRHGDYAPPIAGAVDLASEGASWQNAMQAAEDRGQLFADPVHRINGPQWCEKCLSFSMGPCRNKHAA